jgi:protein-S-isoprenylcysteine O-methyltransferase Ste14
MNEKMTLFATLIILCWSILIISWIVTAISTKHTIESQKITKRLVYGTLFFLGFCLLLEGLNQPAPNHIILQHRSGFNQPTSDFNQLILGFNQPIYPFYLNLLPHSSEITFIGLLITIMGLSFALWARIVLGSNWSLDVNFKEKHELIQQGPYAYVRHPIYSALLLMFSGTAIAIGNLGGFLGFPVLFISFWIKLNQEETLLIRHFKEEYLNYKKKVKALIPYLL